MSDNNQDAKCGALCPEALLDNTLCPACTKKQHMCKAASCKVMLAEDNPHELCPSCTKARNDKWVSKDALKRCLLDLQESQ